jgi:hypothetical protein
MIEVISVTVVYTSMAVACWGLCVLCDKAISKIREMSVTA